MSVSDPLNYSAATKLLDAAVDQAVREEYPLPPAILKRKNEPAQVPEPPDDEYEQLRFGRIGIDVVQLNKPNGLAGKWHLYVWHSNYESSFAAAAADMASAFEEAARGLRKLIADGEVQP
jgi:hypothetical protein